MQEEAREAARLVQEDARVARLAQAAEQARAEGLHAHLCRLDPAFAAEYGAPSGSIEEVLPHCESSYHYCHMMDSSGIQPYQS